MSRAKIKAGDGASAAMRAARSMPSLSHFPGRRYGKPFDQAQSCVIEFLTGHPDIRLWVFNVMRRSDVIAYNRKTRKWQGKAKR